MDRGFQRIAVVGAGHGGCAAAADLTLQGREVRLYGRNQDRLLAIQERGITVTGARQGTAKPALVTDRLDVALADVDLVVVVLPAHAHEQIAIEAAGKLREDQVVYLNPGHTGGALHFQAVLRQSSAPAARLCESVSLTYVCRLEGPAEVAIYSDIQNLLFAALPAHETASLLEQLKPLFPQLTAAKHVLETGLMNMNAVMHPPGMLLNAGWIEQTSGNFHFYSEGNSPAVAAVIEAVDGERLAIGRAFGLELVAFLDFFFKAGLTTPDAYQSGSLYRAIRESVPNRTIKAPGSLQNRYLDEDIPFGLVPMMAFAKLGRVPTPTMGSLIQIASIARGKDYRKVGLSLGSLGLLGRSPAAVISEVMGE
jgi:opine dehydrogenase